MRLISLLAILVSVSVSNADAKEPPRKLRVALYPYIPPYTKEKKHEKLKTWLEERLKTLGVNAQVDFVNTYEDPTSPLKLLAGKYDVVELDLSYTKGLAAEIREWTLPKAGFMGDVLKVADATKPLFWPTYACTHVFYSRDKGIGTATTTDDFVKWLGDGIWVGDLKGSTTLPGVYADAYLDHYGKLPAAQDEKVAASLKSIFARCGTGAPANGTGPCFDNTYDVVKEGKDEAAKQFVDGRAKALFGYSEFLFYIQKAKPDLSVSDVFVVSAPLGPASKPILFADGLVVDKDCKNECYEQAQKFAEVFTGPEIQRAIAFGEDSEAGNTKRYLLMSGMGFWSDSSVAADPVYSQLKKILLDATPYREGGPEEDAIKNLLYPKPAELKNK